MTDHSWNLQQALYQALANAEPALAAGGVHDQAPDDAAFPHVEIGESDVLPDDVSLGVAGADGEGDRGLAETITLHVWSRYRGRKETLAILARIHALLHGRALSVAGRASALAFVRSQRVFRDPDGLTRHGVMAVEVIHRN